MSRAMKDSEVPWIGDMPNTWRIERGRHIFTLLERPVPEGAKVVTCFRDGEVTLRENRREEGFTISLKEIGYQGIEPGDLVVHGMDGFAGSIGISDSRGKCTPVLNILDSSQNKKFLMYYLRNMAYGEVFVSLATGIRQRSCDTNWKKLREIEYAVPPLEEQERIADFLDVKTQEVDAAIVKTRESIEEYQKLKQSVITQAVTKGIRPNRNMKDSGAEWIGEIPEEWARVRFKDVFALQKGLSITKDDLRETGVSVISYGQVHSKKNTGTGLSPSLIRFVDEEYLITHPEALVRIGDFIFADTSEDMEGCGNCVYVNEEFLLFAGYHTVIARPKQPHYFRYFAYQFQSALWRSQLRCRVFGIKVYSVSQKILCTTTALLPPLQEQQEIVAYLDEKCGAIDALIEKKQQIITELESYKKSLICEYVTGKKEVPA